MARYIKQTFRIILTVFIITLVFTAANYYAKTEIQILKDFDVLNNLIIKPKVYDITDLFPQREKRKDEVVFIAYHHEACINKNGLMQVHEHHTVVKGWRSIAYHYYITRLGKIYNMLDTATINASEQGYNQSSISICLQGNFDKERLEGKQKIQLLKLLNFLQKKYPDAKILQHKEMNATGCPGENISKRDIWLNANYLHFINHLKPKNK